MSDEARQTPITPATLLGSIVCCPHCDQMLKVIAVARIRSGTNPRGQAGWYYPIQLADGEWARMWTEEW